VALAPVPSREETVHLYQTGGLANELARYHEHEGDNDPFVAQCVDLHNRGDIDLVALPTTAAFAAIDGRCFFAAQHLYCVAIPNLQTEVIALMACCSALVKQAGNDGAASQPYGAFQQWCAANPEQAQSVVARARNGDAQAKEFVSFALRSTDDSNTAIQFVQSYSDERRIAGMHALRHIRYADVAAGHSAVSVLEPFLVSGTDDNVRANALLAAFDILKRHPDMEIAARIIAETIVDAAPLTLQGLAQVVGLHEKLMDDVTLGRALATLQATPLENPGTVRILDMALHHFVGTPRESLALDFLTEKLRDGMLNLENFGTTAHSLRRGDPEQFYRLVVRWLLSGSIPLCNAVNDLVGSDKEQAFDTTAAPLALSPVQHVFLCRKAIGYLFIKPVVCCSIIISVLRAATPEAAEEIAELLFDPLLLNYGGKAKDYLKLLPATDPAYPFVQTALAKEGAFHKELDVVGTIKELHPSDYQRDVVWQRGRDEMWAAQKLAAKSSLLHSLVHRSAILYGKRTLTYVCDPNGTRRAIAMDLKSVGTSYELPRHEILDPVGLDYMLRVFGVEKLK
jgi:hypothetical protein